MGSLSTSSEVTVEASEERFRHQAEAPAYIENIHKARFAPSVLLTARQQCSHLQSRNKWVI